MGIHVKHVLDVERFALFHAGVPMVSMFSASSCSVQQDGQLLLDPTTEEDEVSGTNVQAMELHTELMSCTVQQESVFSLTLCQRSDDSSGILALSLQGAGYARLLCVVPNTLLQVNSPFVRGFAGVCESDELATALGAAKK